MITKHDRDKWGNIKFYLNIVKGDYFIMNNSDNVTLYLRLNKVKSELDLTHEIERYMDQMKLIVQSTRYQTDEHKYPLGHLKAAKEKYMCSFTYDEFFIKQIIQHHQLLLDLKYQVSTIF